MWLFGFLVGLFVGSVLSIFLMALLKANDE